MQQTQTPLAAVVIRWIARILSIVSIGVLLLFFFGEADFSQPVQLTPREWIGLLFFPGAVVIGMIIGWWREGLGGGIAVGGLLVFYGWNLVAWGSFPSGPFFVMFALPGILFGLSWLLQRQQVKMAT